MTTTNQVVFYVPPRNQGQIVEVSYASVEDVRKAGARATYYVIKRKLDASDGETRYWISKCLLDDEGDYWNGPPRNKRWREISEQEANELLEAK